MHIIILFPQPHPHPHPHIKQPAIPPLPCPALLCLLTKRLADHNLIPSVDKVRLFVCYVFMCSCMSYLRIAASTHCCIDASFIRSCILQKTKEKKINHLRIPIKKPYHGVLSCLLFVIFLLNIAFELTLPSPPPPFSFVKENHLRWVLSIK